MDKLPSSSKTDGDAELLAVRALIAQTDASKLDTHIEQSERNQAHVSKKNQFPAIEPVDEDHTAPDTHAAPRYLQTRTKAVIAALWSRVKAYRPHRASVLLTSLVLLLILQPVFVLGWIFLGLVVTLVCYSVMGGDAFWRRILRLFATWQRVQPATARRYKLHAYVLSRKWDRIVAKLPEQVATKIQMPDLRTLMAADKRHDAALNERLSRLH